MGFFYLWAIFVLFHPHWGLKILYLFLKKQKHKQKKPIIMTIYFFIIILDIWYFPYNVLKRYSIPLLWGRILSTLYELINKTISNGYSSLFKHLKILLNPLPTVISWLHVVLLSNHTISLSLKKQKPIKHSI